MSHHQILAILGITIGFVSYAIYFYGIFYGQTKPHGFTWLVWGIMNITVFFAQLVRGGGAGSWITGINGVLCLAVFMVSLWRGEKNITRSDWWCLGGALAGIVGWIVTHNPLTAVLLASVIDLCAILPTIRKAYYKPYEENVLGFSIDLSAFVLALVALESFNLTTALFPVVILVNDSFLVGMILVRRRSIKS